MSKFEEPSGDILDRPVVEGDGGKGRVLRKFNELKGRLDTFLQERVDRAERFFAGGSKTVEELQKLKRETEEIEANIRKLEEEFGQKPIEKE